MGTDSPPHLSPNLHFNLKMAGIRIAKITTLFCQHLLPFKEGKFGAVWELDGSNSNS